MTAPPSPPRLAERLLRWSLSPEDRQPQLGDLQEEFATLAEHSPGAARRWYWRQALTSVLPNLVRRARHGWQLIARVADEKDRKSRRWRRWSGAALAAMGVVLGVWLARTRHDRDWFYDCLPFLVFGWLIALTGSYRALTFSHRSRRYWLMQGAFWLTAPFTFLEVISGHQLSTRLETIRLALFGLQSLLWMWPRGTWPFHRTLAATEYSLQSPLVTYISWKGYAYEPITVPTSPVAMGEVFVGPASPVDVPPESRIEGVVPMTLTASREFSTDQTLRLFTVVNASAEDLDTALEIRRAATGRLLGRIPATVRPATPKVPRKQAFLIDPDDEPLVPRSIRASEVDVVVPLAAMAPGDYILRVVARHRDGTSFEHVNITVRPKLTLR